jgi:hypothetical protein
MNWVRIKRILSNQFLKRKLNGSLSERFYLRDLPELINKREEFRFKKLELEKQQSDTKKYENYLEVLDWIIKEK